MDLQALYEAAIQAGVEADPRGTKAVRRLLERNRKKYEGASEKERRFLDPEARDNPYADSRILHDAKVGDIAEILVGIDIGVGEVLLADHLNEKGRTINLVLAHHPWGAGSARMSQVMEVQADLFHEVGVSLGAAEALVEKRMSEVSRRFAPSNHQQSVDAARLLGLSMMCAHTVADNQVHTYLERRIRDRDPETLEDVVELLMEEPEYIDAARQGAGPTIVQGSGSRRLGKIKLEMTGGTSGPKELFAGMATAGVTTIIGMHMSEDHLDEARKHNINVLIAGHISSDNLGVNLLLDQLDAARGTPFTVVEASGFRRFPRPLKARKKKEK
jgi:putative NIF3 family GTP cyclohydrolase 1 type 2